jgi:hypothetical protein
MILKSSSEICKAYGNEIGVSDPITVFIDIETDECIGYYVETDFNQVLFVHKERDYKKIWDKFPNAVRIGCDEDNPYDKGIVGYVVDDEGNGRIVYDDYECCMSLSQSLGISEEDAFDDWGYNTLGSLPNVPIENRPCIMTSIF